MNGFKLNQLPPDVKTGIICYLALVMMVIAFPFYMLSQEEDGEHANHKAALIGSGSIAYADELEGGERHHQAESEAQGREADEDQQDEEHHEGGEGLLKMAHVHLGGHTLLLFTVGFLFALTTLACWLKGAVFVVSAISVALHTVGLTLMQVLGKELVGGSAIVYSLSILFMAAVVIKEMFTSETS